MTSEFGALLCRLRLQAGLTQEQLAERAELGVRTIRRLENGKSGDSRMATIRRIVNALPVPEHDRRTLLALASGAPSPVAESPAEPPVEPVANPPVFRDALTDAAERLASVVHQRWYREEELRNVHDPYPLPVRWKPVAERHADRWENVCRTPHGVSARPLDLTGDLTRIAEIYRGVPSGRLVVLGRAGSGKTVLTIRFVLDYLKKRTSADPVPVIFSLGSWDPTAIPLRDWLIERLLRDDPGLVADAGDGSTLAAALVREGRVLPVLDGFDEIPEGLQGAALKAFNGTTLPLLLTSRPGEYTQAVEAGGVLRWAAVVKLVGLTSTDLINYLPRTGTSGTDTVWDPVLAELRDNPDHPASANLAATLRTPLMVALARTVYSEPRGQDPAALLDAARFPTPEALEDHLLGSFVPTAYGPRAGDDLRRDWTADRVRRWFGHLAHYLDRFGTPDLAWWQLAGSLSPSSRILGVVLASTIVTAVVDCLFSLPVNAISYGLGPGLVASLLDGLLIGPVVGLGFGLVYAIMTVCFGVVFEPSRVRMRLFGRTWTGLVRGSPAFVSRVGAGLLGGFVVGLGYGPASTVIRGLVHGFPLSTDAMVEMTLVNTLVSGIIFGLAAGAVLGVVAALETPLDFTSATGPLTMLATNRKTVIRQVLVLAPMLALAIAFGGKLVVGALQNLLGPLVWDLPGGLFVGTIGGISSALSYALCFTAWGQWLAFSRIWLPLTGRLPWAITTFLDDAYHRGVLRQAGAVYQFRHARLQEHFSRTHDHRKRNEDGQRRLSSPS